MERTMRMGRCRGLIVFIVWTLVMGSNTLMAQMNLAKDFAQEWITLQASDLKTSPSLSALTPLSSNHADLFLAEYEPNGFLIYFFKDNQADIIGYSTDSKFPKSSDHPLLKEWLSQISPSKQSGLKSMKGMTYMNDHQVFPMVEASWGQGAPWNKYCPTDDNGNQALVGCVAVAMGQIMKKWNWPERGVGSNSYTPINHPAYGVQSASFDTAYQWDAMHTKYPTDASALLLYHAGVSTFMNYGPNESGANTSVYAIPSLIDHYRFFKGMQVREKERYSENDWFIMLRQELVNGRPLIYIGSNPDGGAGHAFNIDGYHSQAYFHFNWGWNGAGNGYFRLENMAAGGGNFTKGQAAIFWIQPDGLPMHDRPASFQTVPGDGYVKLQWDGLVINDLSHYNIYRDDEFIGTSIDQSFQDDGLLNGTTYEYYITASYIGGEEGESDPTDALLATPVASLVLPLETGFESNPTQWELKNSSQGFRWGAASELDIPGNNGHVISIRSDQTDPEKQVTDYLASPRLDIRNMPHVAISFDYVFKQEPGVDSLFLMFRRYDDGLWHPISSLDSTGSWSDWKTVYFYFPEGAKQSPIQIGFYYNDFKAQGYGAAIDNIKIWQIAEPPVPGYSASEINACQFEKITYTSQSSGNIYDWFWNFGEGAEPQFGYTEGPHEVLYNTGGTKHTSLLLNHLDSLQKDHLLEVTLAPIAGFDTSINGLLIDFIDTSKNGSYYWWDFGEGKTSTEKNPQNKFHEFKEYPVTQVIYNDYCEPDTMKIFLDLRINSAISETDLSKGLMVYPNPASNVLNFSFLQAPKELVFLQVFDLTGKLILEQQLPALIETQLDISFLKPGIYFLHARSTNQVYLKKIIIE